MSYMAIDDELDAVRKAYPNEPANILNRVLKLASPVSLGAKIITTLREVFSEDAKAARVTALLEALEKVIRRNQKDLPELDGVVRSPEFVETLLVAVHESLNTINLNRVERFAHVLGNTLCQEKGQTNWEETAAFIRDLAQLTEEDVIALRILDDVTGDLARSLSNLHTPDPFTRINKELLTEIHRRGLHPDDFYSRCSRLSGFGLTLPVAFNPSQMSPGEYCFRFTLRGLRLLVLLK
jgi:hypothetical protein